MTREEIIKFALELNNTYVDYPFPDAKYGTCPVLKHKKNDKWFGIFMKVGEDEYMNVKTNPEYSELLRNSKEWIIPAYHMNKQHWNTIIINKSDDDSLIKELVEQSYDLTKK